MCVEAVIIPKLLILPRIYFSVPDLKTGAAPGQRLTLTVKSLLVSLIFAYSFAQCFQVSAATTPSSAGSLFISAFSTRKCAFFMVDWFDIEHRMRGNQVAMKLCFTVSQASAGPDNFKSLPSTLFPRGL
jgi:hypothetical protein